MLAESCRWIEEVLWVDEQQSRLVAFVSYSKHKREFRA